MDSREFTRAAHDLNNILQVLTCRSEQLLRSLESSNPARAGMERIHDDVRNAIAVTRKLVAAGEAADLNSTSHKPELLAVKSPAKMVERRGEMHNATLLYVDDKPERLATLQSVLESAGYAVITADDGAKGLELFLTQPVDLVVLDYYMPSMNGGAVAAQMRWLKPHVPIIIFSGALTLPELVMAMVDGFISTSEEPEVLLEKISALLSVAEARAS